MKKNIYSLVFLLFALISCKNNDEKPFSDANKKIEDSTIVDVDKDKNGCLASAGYVWSKVNKECVKSYTGIQLNPFDNVENEDESLSAYVLFGENGNEAEVFLPNDQSLILKRESEGKPWIKDDYQLIPWKGYVFKKADKILFSGDGELGKKITNTDEEQSDFKSFGTKKDSI